MLFSGRLKSYKTLCGVGNDDSETASDDDDDDCPSTSSRKQCRAAVVGLMGVSQLSTKCTCVERDPALRARCLRVHRTLHQRHACVGKWLQWRRQDFVTGGGEVRYGSIGGSSVQSPPVPVVLSVYQRGSLLDGLAVYLSCDTKKFHDNERTHILHNFWTYTHRGEASPALPPCGGATEWLQYRGRSQEFTVGRDAVRSPLPSSALLPPSLSSLLPSFIGGSMIF